MKSTYSVVVVSETGECYHGMQSASSEAEAIGQGILTHNLNQPIKYVSVIAFGDSDLNKIMHRELMKGNRILAIKAVCAHTGMGLKEAKILCDEYLKEHILEIREVQECLLSRYDSLLRGGQSRKDTMEDTMISFPSS